MAILENQGYSVTGLDLNQEMLDIARTRCSGRLIRQDMREMRLDDTFDALLYFGRAFGYMLNNEDANRAIKCFSRALRIGGILILDCFDAESSRRWSHEREEWRESSFEFEDMKITRRSRSFDYNESDSTWKVEWEYIIENGDRYVARDKAKLRSYDSNELGKMLFRNGFKMIEQMLDRQLTIVSTKYA
jgi:SAM-dependent methyltransferase